MQRRSVEMAAKMLDGTPGFAPACKRRLSPCSLLQRGNRPRLDSKRRCCIVRFGAAALPARLAVVRFWQCFACKRGVRMHAQLCCYVHRAPLRWLCRPNESAPLAARSALDCRFPARGRGLHCSCDEGKFINALLSFNASMRQRGGRAAGTLRWNGLTALPVAGVTAAARATAAM